MSDSTAKRAADLGPRFAKLLRHPVCQALREILENRPCHLVGGALRDAALGYPLRDLDIVVAGDGAAVANRLADRLGSRSIKVGGHRFAAYRVPRTDSPVDIWDRGLVSLEADLRRRDLTIHSFALDLHSGASYDPFSGLQDLMDGRLRMTSTESFADDALRVLRLCRFAAQLPEFRIDPATLAQARESVGDLTGVASERIRSEIELTLEHPNAETAAQLWIDLRVLPEALLGCRLSLVARRELQENLSRAWRAFEDAAVGLATTMGLSSGRLALIMILLERTGCSTDQVAIETLQRKGLANKTLSRRVTQLLDAGNLPAAEPEQRWFLHRLGELWPIAVSLAAAVADQQTGTERRSASLAQVIELATRRPSEIFDPPALISGDDLQRLLPIEPGPRLGRMLAAVRRRQIEGTVTTPEEALQIAARLLAAEDRE